MITEDLNPLFYNFIGISKIFHPTLMSCHYLIFPYLQRTGNKPILHFQFLFVRSSFLPSEFGLKVIGKSLWIIILIYIFTKTFKPPHP